jgi:hypothetical protein
MCKQAGHKQIDCPYDMDGTIFDDEMTQGDVHQEHKDGEQAEEQTEITDVEIEERQERQNGEECSEKIEQTTNKKCKLFWKKPKRTVK